MKKCVVKGRGMCRGYWKKEGQQEGNMKNMKLLVCCRLLLSRHTAQGKDNMLMLLMWCLDRKGNGNRGVALPLSGSCQKEGR